MNRGIDGAGGHTWAPHSTPEWLGALDLASTPFWLHYGSPASLVCFYSCLLDHLQVSDSFFKEKLDLGAGRDGRGQQRVKGERLE